ncbi:hypothetical protein ACHAWF_008533 [Thalassiosira exigua]
MNVRPTDDHELRPSSARVSARNRFSAPPAAAFAGASSASVATSKSKGGINGRTFDSEEEGELVGGLSGRSSPLRNASKRPPAVPVTPANGSEKEKAKNKGDYRLTRQISGGSNASSVNRDRPWRSASNSSAHTSTSASYATARDRDYDATRSRSGGSSSSSSSSSGGGSARDDKDAAEATVAAPSPVRWAQYETDDLAEESRRATSNAVVDMATRLADRQAAEPPIDRVAERETETSIFEKEPIMGGSAGSGYRDPIDPWSAARGDDDAAPLESNGNSLPPAGTSSRSTTDYVKSRLSSLVPQRGASRDATYERGLSGSGRSEHDKVRDEALKMLRIADSCLQDSPRMCSSEPASPRSLSPRNSFTTGLFRTSTGGMAMRELHGDEVDQISVARTATGKREKSDVACVAGLDRFQSSSERPSRYDGTFTIGSRDEEDAAVANENSNGAPLSPNDETPASWSSRYSVERQLMAITGGLDSTRMLAKMDMLHSSRDKTKSARGLYRASGYAMDGSHEDYGDYTAGKSTGLGFGGVWLWLRGTLWSDDLELNHDGTTQSLVRREKAMRRRRRLRWALAFLAGLSVLVGVLVPLGNHKKSKADRAANEDVNFYVLADEPYDFGNIDQLTRELEALPDDAEFVVHLGNANGDAQSRCQEYGFARTAAVLKESPKPVLVVPGDLDWAACGSKEDAERALRYWDVNLGRLEEHWSGSHPLDVDHSDDVVGNFAFLRKGVLFVSLNLVDAETEPDEVTSRLERNVLWTKGKLDEFDDAGYRALVLLGHAPPTSKQGEYFWPLVELVKDLGRPALYLHANSNGSFERYTPFAEAENLRAVQLEKRGMEAPMRVAVLAGAEEGEDMFVFERRDPTMERIEK